MCRKFHIDFEEFEVKPNELEQAIRLAYNRQMG